MSFCPNCGNAVNEKAIICVNCGKSLNNNKLNASSSIQGAVSDTGTIFKKLQNCIIISVIGTILSSLTSSIPSYTLNSMLGWNSFSYYFSVVSQFIPLIFSVMSIIGIIICINSCEQFPILTNNKSKQYLNDMMNVVKLIKNGLLILIVATVLYFICSFFGSTVSIIVFLYYEVFSYQFFFSIIGIMLRIVQIVGYCFIIFACAKGSKIKD